MSLSTTSHGICIVASLHCKEGWVLRL